MTTTINASPSNGLVQTADGSGILKVQSNGVTTNALAWVKFAGASGTIASSYNVSSVTRASTGDYTVNFASTLADANYAPALAFQTAAGGGGEIFAVNTPSTSALRVQTLTYTGASYEDKTAVYVSIFGN